MIDSSIPLSGLGAQQLNPNGVMDATMNWAKLGQIKQSIAASQQQVEASKAAQAQTEAGTPGVAAESAIKQRAAAFNQWKTDNADKYTNSDGSLNINNFVGHANKAGFATEAQSVAASDLVNKSQAIANSTNDQNRLIAQSNYVSTGATHISTLLDTPGLTDNQKSAQLSKYVDFMNKQVPGAGDQILNLFGKSTPDGKITVNNDAIKATATATMTKQEQVNNKINQQNANTSAQNAQTSAESTRQAGVAQVSGPDARNPNSEQSKLAVKAAQEAGIQGIVPGVTSAADLAHLPGVAGQVEATTVPAATKSAAATGAVTETQTAQIYNNADSLVNNLIKKGMMTNGTNVGQFISSNAAKFGNDPDFRALQAALNQITAVNPSIDINKVNAQGLSAQLRSQQTLSEQRAATSAKIATAPTFNKIPGTESQPGLKSNNGGTIKMINKSGHMISIPPGMVDRAVKDGYVRAQ